MRLALAAFLVLHGVAHLPGFLVPWRLWSDPALSYRTTLMGGDLDLGETGVRLVGVLWLLAGAAFVVAGIAIFRRWEIGLALTLIVTLLSLGLSVLNLPDSKIGLMLNLVLLAILAFGRVFGWTA